MIQLQPATSSFLRAGGSRQSCLFFFFFLNRQCEKEDTEDTFPLWGWHSFYKLPPEDDSTTVLSEAVICPSSHKSVLNAHTDLLVLKINLDTSGKYVLDSIQSTKIYFQQKKNKPCLLLICYMIFYKLGFLIVTWIVKCKIIRIFHKRKTKNSAPTNLAQGDLREDNQLYLTLFLPFH